jgi:hypothetical protein
MHDYRGPGAVSGRLIQISGTVKRSLIARS